VESGGGDNLNILIFLDLTPIQIHNRALNVVGMYFKKKMVTSTGCILHNSREPTAVARFLSVVFYIKL
jgi:hypothetical protein